MRIEKCIKAQGNELSKEAGLMLAEAFGKQGASQQKIMSEKFGITYKEAGQTTTTDSGAYTNLLASTLYTAAIEQVDKILGLVEINEDLKNKGGFGAMQLPRLTPTQATVVAEGAVINYFPEGIDAVTVTCVKVAAGTSITWEILKRGMSDFARYVLKNAADAVARKLATDIVDGLAAGSTLTPETSGISLAKVLSAEAKVNDATHSNGVKFGFIANALVMTPTVWATFRQDTDVKAAMYYASAIPGAPVNAATMPLMFGNLEVIVTPFLTAAQALILEKKRNILVKENDLETFEGQIPGRLWDREVLAMMSYVLAILWPKSVCTVAN